MSTSSPPDIEPSPERNRPWLPQFDLPFLFEIVAGAALAIVLCVELGPLGVGKIAAAVNVLFLIAYVCNERVRRKFTLVEFLVIVAINGILAALVMPAVTSGWSRARASEFELRRIGRALQKYLDEYGAYPPAVVNDAAGNPMHGWQIFLQPMLDRLDLYDSYDFKEPWDGPNNQRIAANRPVNRRAASAGTTLLFVSGHERWTADQAPRLNDITDGPEQTILVVESDTVNAMWTQPRPLTVDEFLQQARSGQLAIHKYQRHDWAPWREGMHVLMADGEMRILRADLDERTWRALLTPAGGETIDLDDVLFTQGELPVLRMLLLTAGYVLIVSWRHWRPRRFRTSPLAVP